MTLDDFQAVVPERMWAESGRALYSGQASFSERSDLYIIGVSPGGNPVVQARETVLAHSTWVLSEAPRDWSAFRDESWRGKPRGAFGLQPRLLHLFRRLNLSPGSVPATNLVFTRSRSPVDLSTAPDSLASACWAFHEHVLFTSKARVILCLGHVAGEFVCNKLNASVLERTFVENNNRRFESRTYVNAAGVRVVVAAHPGTSDWTNPNSDPTSLVASALEAS